MKEKLKMFTTFSGIGCQERGFLDSDLFDIDVVATSDVDKDAIVSYAAIHCGLTQKMIEEYSDYPSKEDMVDELKQKNIGYEFIKNKAYDWDKLSKRKGKNIEKYWLALKLSNNLGDIGKIQIIPECDVLTFSFPCQSISIAGKQEGIIKHKTRSGLVYEIIRLLQVAKQNNMLPKYLMLENVFALVSKKFKGDFDNLNLFFDSIGYNVYWSLINGKDCGVPQNRSRCFAIYIRKDIDTGKYTFPLPFDAGIRLKDVLEEQVDEKYYLSETALKKFQLFDKSRGNDIKVAGSINPDKNVQDRVRVLDVEGIAQGLRATDYKDPVKIAVGIDKSSSNTKFIEYSNCITAREDRGVSNYEGIGTAILENIIHHVGSINNSQDGVVVTPGGISKTHTAGHNNCPKIIEMNKMKQVGQLYGTDKEPNPQAGRVYDEEYLSPTIGSCGGNQMPKIIESGQIRPKDRNYNAHGTKREDQFETRKDGLRSAVLTTSIKNCIREDYRIRKLTPRECWKLMGLTFEDCDKAASLGVADTHLYKQAGNGIITNCCELLAEHLYKAQYDNTYVCTDERCRENFTRPQVE